MWTPMRSRLPVYLKCSLSLSDRKTSDRSRHGRSLRELDALDSTARARGVHGRDVLAGRAPMSAQQAALAAHGRDAGWAGSFECSGPCRRKRLVAAEFSKKQIEKRQKDEGAPLKCKQCVEAAAAEERQQAAARQAERTAAAAATP